MKRDEKEAQTIRAVRWRPRISVEIIRYAYKPSSSSSSCAQPRGRRGTKTWRCNEELANLHSHEAKGKCLQQSVERGGERDGSRQRGKSKRRGERKRRDEGGRERCAIAKPRQRTRHDAGVGAIDWRRRFLDVAICPPPPSPFSLPPPPLSSSSFLARSHLPAPPSPSSSPSSPPCARLHPSPSPPRKSPVSFPLRYSLHFVLSLRSHRSMDTRLPSSSPLRAFVYVVLRLYTAAFYSSSSPSLSSVAVHRLFPSSSSQKPSIPLHLPGLPPPPPSAPSASPRLFSIRRGNRCCSGPELVQNRWARATSGKGVVGYPLRG